MSGSSRPRTWRRPSPAARRTSRSRSRTTACASRYVTALPEDPLGRAADQGAATVGVETDHIIRRPGRLGVYFVEAGAAQRASSVVYDRDGAAIALAEPDEFDWEAIFEALAGSTSRVSLRRSRRARGHHRSRASRSQGGRCHDLDRPQLPGQAVALRQIGARGHAADSWSTSTWPSATRRTASTRWASTRRPT